MSFIRPPRPQFTDYRESLRWEIEQLKAEIEAKDAQIAHWKATSFNDGFEQSLELEKHKELLNEARDWLCPHNDAKERLGNLKEFGRAWCCDCSNYVRREESMTLIDRIDALLTPDVKKTDNGKM